MVLLLICINILHVFVHFSIEYEDITTLKANIYGNYQKRFNALQSFQTKAIESDNWLLVKFSEIAQGFTDAVNLVLIGFHLIVLILSAYIQPSYGRFIQEGSTILGAIGMLGVLYLYWFNVTTIMKLYKFIKGSDQ